MAHNMMDNILEAEHLEEYSRRREGGGRERGSNGYGER